jgi:MFS family permease
VTTGSTTLQPSWRYLPFLLPLIAIAVGMGMSNGTASSAATASVSHEQVGAASGVSNMARYVGAAVATALAATIYATVPANRTAAGKTASEALSAGLALASWVMAAFSFAGVLMAFVMARHRAAKAPCMTRLQLQRPTRTHSRPRRHSSWSRWFQRSNEQLPAPQ